MRVVHSNLHWVRDAAGKGFCLRPVARTLAILPALAAPLAGHPAGVSRTPRETRIALKAAKR
jgi:hypothetical protein